MSEIKKCCRSCKYYNTNFDCYQCYNYDEWEKYIIVKKNYDKPILHERICSELTETYKKKNNDYGDSFADLRKEYSNSILIRIYDKYKRLKTLKSGVEQRVADESIKDTLKDLANYCIMELIEMEIDEGEQY